MTNDCNTHGPSDWSNDCNTHGPSDWSSECKECFELEEKKLRDRVTDEMFSILSETYHLKTGDISPEDTWTLDNLVKRFIENNR